MHPGINGPKLKDKPAIIMAGSGDIITHQELNELSNQGAQLFRSLGLKPGDSMAFMMENHKLFFPIAFAAYRSGLKYTAISWRLQASEVEYIVKDCGAKVFITSKFLEESAKSLVSSLKGVHKFMLDEAIEDFRSYEEEIGKMPDTPIEDECQGAAMLYSSGTTGRPKGIYREMALNPLPYTQEEEDLGLGRVVEGIYGGDENTVYLSPAPLYHSAPLGFNTGFLSLGGTSVVMEKFDPEAALKAIQDHKITHSQWVPTMFVRFLKIEESNRQLYDLSSHKVAIHAAAPCPQEVKEAMIKWWGPILYEYYAGTEFNGMTIVNSEEWMQHKGTVGKALFGELHILDDEGNELRTYIPEETFTLATTYRPAGLEKLKVGMTVNWQSTVTNTSGGNESKQESYALVNLMAGYDFTDNFNAKLRVNNVTDEKYLSSLRYFGQSYYGAPTNANLSLNYTF